MKNKRLIVLSIMMLMATNSSHCGLFDDIVDAVSGAAGSAWNSVSSWAEKEWKKVEAAGGKVGDFFTTPPWGKGYKYTFNNLSNKSVRLSLNYQGHPNNPVKRLTVPAKGKTTYKTAGWNVGYCLISIGSGGKTFSAKKIASAEAILPLCKDISYWIHEVRGVHVSWFLPLRDEKFKKGLAAYMGHEPLANAAIGYIDAVHLFTAEVPELLQKGLGPIYKVEELAQEVIDVGQDLFIKVHNLRRGLASSKKKIKAKRGPLDKRGYKKDVDDLLGDIDAIDKLLGEIAATLENCTSEDGICALDEEIGKKIKCDKGILCTVIDAIDKVVLSLYEADGTHKLKRDQKKIAAIIGVTTKEGPTADSDEMREAIEDEKYSCILFNKNKHMSLPDHMIEGLINAI